VIGPKTEIHPPAGLPHDCPSTLREPTLVADAAIRGYQRWISPYKGFRCAHRHLHGGHSCSEFARLAVLEQGVLAALPDIRIQFRECREAALFLRHQRRAARRLVASDGYDPDDFDEEDESDESEEEEDRMITDRFYEESEKKRKRLAELGSNDPHYSDCPDWCFFSCAGLEFLGPFCCWSPW
jgi:putative component of membrane protein insertase Oxa1/YidC/SpoIIIJ protein YidD